MRIVTLLLLTALINGAFLTGCAGLRLQHPARFQPPTLNQSADPLWEAVFAVPVDSPIHVELGTRDLIRGRFRSADEQTLILVEGRNVRGVPRTEIRRVLLVRGSHVKKGALWGLGVGAVTSAIVVLRSGDEGIEIAPVVMLIFGGIGTGAGALFGAVFPKRELIYEAPVSGAGKDQGQVLLKCAFEMKGPTLGLYRCLERRSFRGPVTP